MADGLVLNFGAQRNESYLRTWRLTDRDTGVPLDISNWTFVLRIHSAADMPTAPELNIGMTTSFDINASRIRIIEAANGEIEVYIKQIDVAFLSGLVQEIRRFPFNLMVADISAVERALVRGIFTVEPGV